VSVVQVDADDALARLEFSRTRLLLAAPDLSAEQLMRRRQWLVLAVVLAVGLVALVWAPLGTLVVIVAICTAVYFATVVHRVVITMLSRHPGTVLSVSDDEARAVPDHELPIYTVLVPAFREPEVIGALLTHLRALEYPADRLDVKLLLEADDTETVERAMAHPLADSVDIVLVPPGEPRTKPKALNYGLTLATGELVTIYDAEDQPEPLQLRRAAVAFGRLPPDVACMQAQLTYRNPDQNIITRWFTTEYLMWFALFLPGLAATNAPVPLGGTSNHIRRSVLEGLGGWDPYNVTEDADLGVRLHRVGWRCAVLESDTYEEANSDFVNWMKQRSRWYKGYLQTWLVHLRHPVRLWRELGPNGFLQFNLFVGGTPLLALLNPLFWGLTILWFLGKFLFIQQLFPAPVYYAGLFCWVVGNLSVAYLTVLAARRAERPSLVVAALFVPAYWLMMSLSAIKAAIQLVAAPNFWEKTAHGLDGASPAVIGSRAAAATAGPSVRSVGAHQPPGWGAPALVAAQVRSTTTASHLERGARWLRTAGLVGMALLLWLVAGTAVMARLGSRDLASRLAHASTAAPAAGAPVARISIPSAHLSVVAVEGAGAAQLDRAPGHLAGSAWPGGPGNSVVVGHQHLYGSPFRSLDRVRSGDTITVTTPWGSARYRVVSSAMVSAGRVDLVPTGHDRLTLVTGGSGARREVRAVLTSAALATPTRGPDYPALPAVDPAAILIAALWAGVAALGWRAARWFSTRWGGQLAILMGAPVLLVAAFEAFTAVGHIFPGTF
jgi:LPXTG-site transpeptidase (sortase) family protein